MKNYEKPVVLVNEELAEGVYAASGDCWTASVKSFRQVGDSNEYWVDMLFCHNGEEGHSNVTFTATFNQDVSLGCFNGNGSASASGNTVTGSWSSFNGGCEWGPSMQVFATSDTKKLSEPSLSVSDSH